MAAQFFDALLLLALVAWGAIGIGRALELRSRGKHVLAADRQRTIPQMAIDTLAGVCLLVWAVTVISCGMQLQAHWPGKWLGRVVVDLLWLRIAGAVMIALALWLYRTAIRELGDSWRLGIDREQPGQLVTTGVYRWCRHPVYVAFDMIFVGAFLSTGRVVYLVLALVWLPMMHLLMLREERFLASTFGSEFGDYAERVGRYFTWPR